LGEIWGVRWVIEEPSTFNEFILVPFLIFWTAAGLAMFYLVMAQIVGSEIITVTDDMPLMTRRAIVASAALLLLLAAAGAPRRRARVGEIEFSFELPANFQIGRFARGDVLQDAAVLVEREQLGNHPLDAIPVGDVPAIWMNVIRKDQFEFLSTTIPKFDQYRTAIDGRRVWKLPAFPGPYGDQLFYYIVPIGMGGRSLEIGGHRYYFDRDGAKGAPSHYDAVIERIIATLAR
jgi:hypothetical protein